MKLFLLSSLALFQLVAGTGPSTGSALRGLKKETRRLEMDPIFLQQSRRSLKISGGTSSNCATACNGVDPQTISVKQGFVLTSEAFNMAPTGYLYNAGQPDTNAGNYELLGVYWLVYDCSVETMYAKALINDEFTIEASKTGVSWVKTGNDKWLDETDTTFRYIFNSDNKEIGFVGSFPFEKDQSSCGFQVHVNNNLAQTASSGRNPEFCFDKDCDLCSAGCDDSDACTTDSCDTTTGYCNHLPQGGCGAFPPIPTTPTTPDSPTASPPTASPPTAEDSPSPTAAPVDPCAGVDCDDGYSCSLDACQVVDGQPKCVHTAIANHCDQYGQDCTVDSCIVDVLVIDPLAGPTRDNGSGCVHTPNDAFCGDSIGCTTDTCNVDTGCINDPVDSFCSDPFSCTIDTCDPGNNKANAETGCVNSPDDTKCNDGISCTVDTCSPFVSAADAATGCLNEPEDTRCDDHDSCTHDYCRPGDSSSGSDGCVAEEFCCPFGDFGYSYKCATTQYICASSPSNLYKDFVASGVSDDVYELETCTVGKGSPFVVKKKGAILAEYDAVVELPYPECIEYTQEQDSPFGVDSSGKCPNGRGISNYAVAKCVSDHTCLSTQCDLWGCCGKTDVEGELGAVDVAGVCGTVGPSGPSPSPDTPGPSPSPWVCEREDLSGGVIVDGCATDLVCSI